MKQNIINAFLNSKFWYEVYYKHTKKHKQELIDIRYRAYDVFFGSVGKRHPNDKREI